MNPVIKFFATNAETLIMLFLIGVIPAAVLAHEIQCLWRRFRS